MIALKTEIASLRKGIVYKKGDSTITLKPSDEFLFMLSQNGIVVFGPGGKNKEFPFSDYGKTWAIEKEELK